VSKEKIKTEEPTNKTPENTAKEGKVGTMLRDVRTKNKISIEQVANDLRIKSSYLNAIENSDYSNIPAHPYGIGFVRSYANYLGLNSNRITQIFKEETENNTLSAFAHKTYTAEEKTDNNTQNSKYLLISLGMLLFGYVLWSVFNTTEESVVIDNKNETSDIQEATSDTFPLQIDNFSSSEENSNDTNPPQDTQIVISEEELIDTTKPNSITTETSAFKAIDEKAKPASDSTVPQTTTPDKKQGRVILKIKKETWIEVRDSHQEKLWISKVLNAGDEYTIPENGKNKIVSFGNTDGVDVVIDGKIVTIVSKNKKTNINLDAFLNNH